MSIRAQSIINEKSSGKEPTSSSILEKGDVFNPNEEKQVFKKLENGVDFRTVGWPRASVIFLKGSYFVRSTPESLD